MKHFADERYWACIESLQADAYVSDGHLHDKNKDQVLEIARVQLMAAQALVKAIKQFIKEEETDILGS